MSYPKDANGRTVKIGDRVRGEGHIKFQDGFKVDRTPIVTVSEKNGVLYFGGLSAKSFRRFWIIEQQNT